MPMTMEQVFYGASTRTVHSQSSSGQQNLDSLMQCERINNLATAQVRKDTPSLIDVKSLGRPKEFTGREEDFPTVVEEDGGILR